MARGARGSAQELGDGLGSAWRCQGRSANLGGLLQMLSKMERLLEAAVVLGRCWAEVLEVQRCLGSNPEEQSWSGTQRSCRSSPEKTTTVRWFRRAAAAVATSRGCRRVLRRCWCYWRRAEGCRATGRPLQNFAEESSEVQGGGSCCCWAPEQAAGAKAELAGSSGGAATAWNAERVSTGASRRRRRQSSRRSSIDDIKREITK